MKYISGKVGGQLKTKSQDLPESGGLQTGNVPWRLSYSTVKVIINTGMFEMVLIQPRKRKRWAAKNSIIKVEFAKDVEAGMGNMHHETMKCVTA